ncbi:MAG: hypothetical protein QXH07_06370 [Thermoplasmata archaeon]
MDLSKTEHYNTVKPNFWGNEKEVLKFYDQFQNAKSLIRWLKSVKKMEPKIIIKKSKNTNVIAVIPTMRRENIRHISNKYKFTIVFAVNSGKSGHFNYAHSVNCAIKEALNYNPKWIVVANDDIKDVGDTEALYKILANINNRDFDVVFPHYLSRYPYSHNFKLVKYRFYTGLFFKLFRKKSYLTYKIHKKYGVKIIPRLDSFREKIVFRTVKRFINVGDFSIISTEFIKKRNNKLFDENFLNADEDIEVSILFNSSRIKYIDYQMDCGKGGNSLNHNSGRFLRDTAGEIYLYYRYLKHSYK